MKRIVAIEVCPDAIRAAEIIKPLSKSPKISKIGEIMIPAGIAGESQILDADIMVEAFKQLWANEKFSTKRVVLVVSGRRFITRSHETAHVSFKTLDPVLSFEAAAVVPEGMSNPVIDFLPTHHIEAKGSIKTVGLVIATPAEPIEGVIGVMLRAGLEIDYVDFAPISIARFIKNNVNPDDYGPGYAVANIREKTTDILIAKDGIPRMIRVASAGLEPIGGPLGKHFVDRKDEVLVASDGSIGASPIDTLAREIRISVTSQIEALGIMIKKLYVTGPRSDENTVKQLSEILDMDVEALNADNVSSVGEIDKQLSASDFVAVCAGMRGKK